jgi:hypothetical protein
LFSGHDNITAFSGQDNLAVIFQDRIILSSFSGQDNIAVVFRT